MDNTVAIPAAKSVSGRLPPSRKMRRAWASEIARRLRRHLAGSVDRVTRRAKVASVARWLRRSAAVAAIGAYPLLTSTAVGGDWTYAPGTPITSSGTYPNIVIFTGGDTLNIAVGNDARVAFGSASPFGIYTGVSGSGLVDRSTISTVNLSGKGTVVFGSAGVDESWTVGSGQSFTTELDTTSFQMGGDGTSGGVGGSGTMTVLDGATVSFGRYAGFGGAGRSDYSFGSNGGSGGAGALNISGGTTTFSNRAMVGGYGAISYVGNGGNGGQGNISISGGTTTFGIRTVVGSHAGSGYYGGSGGNGGGGRWIFRAVR